MPNYAYNNYMAEYYKNMAMYQNQEPEIDRDYFVKPYDVQAANSQFVSRQNIAASMGQWAGSRAQYGIPITSITPYVFNPPQ